ncbi:AAA family ATPase [Kutzneria sp. NPDC052558]|uniref:AAA family ATPase n=1 Tax=Kutzneria sp. NPDC052558 TaxID=3364121 RepID=UPI0037C712EB
MPELVERDGQLSRLSELLAQATAGSGHTALVEGPAVTGRSELLHAFGRSADALRLQAVCSPAESSLSLGVVGQLLARPGLPPRLRAHAAGVIRNGDASAEVLSTLCLDVLDLADRRPTLVSIDDVHHADPASLRWLAYLARRIGAAPVLVVASSVSNCGPEFRATRAELLRLPNCEVLPLDLLSRPAVDELLARELGEPIARRHAAAVHAASSGNPLLVTAMIEDWRRDHEIVGRCYREALLAGIRRTGPDATLVAGGLAVIGDPTLLDRLLGLDHGAEVMRSLESSGLLADGAFINDTGRQAVLDELPNRGELHQAAARLLHDRGEPAVVVAPHIVAGGHAEDVPSTTVLLTAAENHLLDNGMTTAVACLEHAVSYSPTPDIRARLALVECRADPMAAARHLTQLITDVRAGELSLSHSLELCRQLLWQGRSDEAAVVVDRLWAEADRYDEGTLAELQAFEYWLACTYPRLARRTNQRLPPRPAQTTGGLVLAGVLVHGDLDDTAEGLLRQADLRRDTFWTKETPLVPLMSQMYAGRTESAARWCERWTQDKRVRELPVIRARLAATAAEIAVRRGDFATALAEAKDSLTQLSPRSWGTVVGFPLGAAILAATRTGDLAAAAEHLRLPVPPAMFESRYGLHYLHARGHYHLACDNSRAALADFHTCGDLVRSWSLDRPELVPWRINAAEALLRQGEVDQARRLLNDQLARIGADLGFHRGRALRLLAACGAEHRRVDLLGDAVEIIEAGGDRYELARALADLSRAHQAAGEQRRARLIARRAWHMARGCHAEPLCRELFPDGDDIDADIADDDAIRSLTRAERRVAVLASAGHSNRAIARKLFVTESTVEQHMTKIYRKLNVKHRDDLPVLPLAEMANLA